MERIKGIVTRFLKQDEETGNVFAVIRYETPAGLVDAKMGANARDLEEGDFFVADGVWRSSSFRGQTEDVFTAKSVRPDLPETEIGAARWISSILNASQHGVTQASAETFAKKMGPRTALLCEKNPELILGATSDPTRFREPVLKEWGRRVSGRKVVTLLEKSGVDQKAIASLLDAFRDSALDVLNNNPYDASRVPNFGFQNADRVGQHIGIAAHDERRVGAAFVEAVDEVRREGDTFASLSRIGEILIERYGIDLKTATDFAVKAARDPRSPLIVDQRDGQIVAMLRDIFMAEAAIARGVVSLLKTEGHYKTIADGVVDKVLAQDKFKKFDAIQQAGVRMASRERFSILTGGPGTGKSTVTEAIAQAAEVLDGGKIILAAPTGKAAKRLEETTGKDASTLHRLLEARLDARTGGSVFQRNKTNPLPAGSFVVVDEASMIDVFTMKALIEAMPPDGRLLLVGDRNQLPSVDAGAVLGDLISAQAGDMPITPRTELINVYRQSRDSRIATGAAEIRQGMVPAMTNKFEGGLGLYEHAPDQIIARIEWLVRDILIGKLRYQPNHIAILTPQAPGSAGTWEVNRVMSKMLNPGGRAIEGVVRSPDDNPEMPIPRVGDRVMLTENDDANDVMNGDVGSIIDAYRKAGAGTNDRPFLKIRFDCGKEVEYPAALWRRLVLAYAITIHKSQGSQYEAVIMPVTPAHERMLDRSILYTGWTRAKSMLFLVGERETIQAAVDNVESSRRSTRLGEFLARAAREAQFTPRVVQIPATSAPGPALPKPVPRPVAPRRPGVPARPPSSPEPAVSPSFAPR